ncbi:hypothetical protein EV690_1675 [Celerinatantimonas diazotrophica]|uniref:Uncharacterized protein n=1 Tax=Celerinatantimonas diazotrophica TaxID=412034 RepID=A0A4V2PR96_9GAMM|nr:hypothetical protein EV690_1675 [Celerinatantimonas diazotrophica]CAG9297960.1 hypothetical protein CEDIAZO_03152 [Celerinatantimonas diazotrophica]
MDKDEFAIVSVNGMVIRHVYNYFGQFAHLRVKGQNLSGLETIFTEWSVITLCHHNLNDS